MRATRILYLASVDLPHRKARAIQIVNTSHALALEGARVTLVGGRRGAGSVLEPLGLHAHPSLRIRRLPVLRAPAPLDQWYTRVWQISYLVGLTISAPDLALSTRPDAILVRDLRLAWILVHLGKKIARRVIFEAHDLSSFEAELKGNAAAARSLAAVESRVFRDVGAVIAIASPLRDLILKRHRLDGARIHVIADATSLPDTQPIPIDRREGVYYVGQIYPWKGVDTLIKAAPECPGLTFEIVGGTEDGLEADRDVQRMHALANELGIGARVHFPGWVPYSEVRSILSRARVAVIPLPDTPFGRYFTSPLKLFDYMAAGAPIVASDLPALRDVLRHESNALLVPPGDATALARAIQRLNDDSELANRLTAQALLDVRTYSWSARAIRILDVVQSLSGEGEHASR